MKISEFFKQTGNNISKFCQCVFGDDPKQYVETGDGTLIVAAASDKVPKSETAELVKALRDAKKSGDFLSKTIDGSIQLDSDDNGFNTTSFAERKTYYRDSEGMKNIRNQRNDIPANTLKNSPREQGGEERTKSGH